MSASAVDAFLPGLEPKSKSARGADARDTWAPPTGATGARTSAALIAAAEHRIAISPTRIPPAQSASEGWQSRVGMGKLPLPRVTLFPGASAATRLSLGDDRHAPSRAPPRATRARPLAPPLMLQKWL